MTIVEALRAATRHVGQHRATLPLDASEDDTARTAAEVSALGHELDSLAAASETAPVYRREFEAIRGELERRGLALPPEVVRAVDDAFVAEAASKIPPRRARFGQAEVNPGARDG